jgi:hypothetical protein
MITTSIRHILIAQKGTSMRFLQSVVGFAMMGSGGRVRDVV